MEEKGITRLYLMANPTVQDQQEKRKQNGKTPRQMHRRA